MHVTAVAAVIGGIRAEGYFLPKQLDEQVSALHFRALGSMLNIFAEEGADCIGVRLEGPLKHTSTMWVHGWLRIATFLRPPSLKLTSSLSL